MKAREETPRPAHSRHSIAVLDLLWTHWLTPPTKRLALEMEWPFLSERATRHPPYLSNKFMLSLCLQLLQLKIPLREQNSCWCSVHVSHIKSWTIRLPGQWTAWVPGLCRTGFYTSLLWGGKKKPSQGIQWWLHVNPHLIQPWPSTRTYGISKFSRWIKTQNSTLPTLKKMIRMSLRLNP